MKYIKNVKTDAEMVTSSEYDILYLSDESQKAFLKEMLAKYFVEISANGEGILYLNPGYFNGDGISATIDGTTYRLENNKSRTMVVSGVTYYEYENINVGELYIDEDLTSKSQGDVVSLTLYAYEEETMVDVFEGLKIEATVLKYSSSYDGPVAETVTYLNGDSQKIKSSSEVVSIKTYIDTEETQTENTTLTSIKIPNTVASLDERCFYHSYALNSVELPDTITTIPVEAFAYCSGLTSIVMNKVTSIEYEAFKETGLENIDFLSSTIESIGDGVFRECLNLTSATIPNSVTYMGNSVFNQCTSLISITIPNNFTNIPDSFLQGCTSLTSVTIPEDVQLLGNYAFNNCQSLKSIIIPNNVTDILDSTFNSCTSLTSLTLSNTIRVINSQTFYNCTSLTSITIPNSISIIGNNAFGMCTNLESVTYDGNSYTSKTELQAAFTAKGVECTVTNAFLGTALTD